MGTFSAKSHEVRRGWYVVDATGQTLGRLASAVAFRLRGKHKPEFTPHVDTGDYIVIINAANIRVTGNKLKDKLYRHHTGYVGNMKTIALGKMMQEHPERAITKAVKGMLPKNHMSRTHLTRLKVYVGGEHPHASQKPQALEL